MFLMTVDIRADAPEGAASSLGAATSADSPETADFRSFLERPPWIKRVVFGRSGEQDRVIEPGKRPRSHAGVIWMEGAIQPATAYLKALSNSVAGANKLAGNGSIVGFSRGQAWALSGDSAELVFSNSQDGITNSTELLEQSVQSQIDEIRRMMRLGIHHLKLGSLRWLSGEEFEAASEGGFGVINGNATGWAENVPNEIRYIVERAPEHEFIG
ncbi:MAG: hypothetical protein KF833_12150, partial [Verrucomicrobiae bacterium]|nr:hypothetical protein [Verrucomicrobiae bacterium]